MNKITILTLCTTAIISICVAGYHRTYKEAENVLVEAGSVYDSLSVALIKAREAMIQQQIEEKVANEYEAQQKSMQKSLVTVYDKQGYDHYVRVKVLDYKLSIDEAQEKLQSIYSGLSKSEASDVNKAYLQRVVGEGFDVEGIVIFAESNPNSPKATAERAAAEVRRMRSMAVRK